MDASIVVSLRIGSARNLRPTGNREVPRVGHGGRGYGPPGAGRCQWASCGLSLLRCPAPLCPAPASWPARWPSRQGSLWRERPPCTGGKGPPPWPPPLSAPVVHQRRKSGGRSHHQHPSRAARRYAKRGGDRRRLEGEQTTNGPQGERGTKTATLHTYRSQRVTARDLQNLQR